MERTREEPDDNRGTTSRFFWELYLWLLFVIQMLSWVAFLAGQPSIFDYIAPAVNVAGWIGVWCYFRGYSVFEAHQWRWYFYGLMAWEVLYGILMVTGVAGIPLQPKGMQYQPTVPDVLMNFVFLSPFYLALYKMGTTPQKSPGTPDN